MDPRLQSLSEEASLADAMERFLVASQQILADRTDLLLLDLRGAIRDAVRGGLFAGLALGLGLGGWFALLGAGISAATPEISLAVLLVAAGVANLAVAAAIARAALSLGPRVGDADGPRGTEPSS